MHRSISLVGSKSRASAMTIVLTLPTFITNEVDAIVRLFDEQGIDRLHIRKPEADTAQVAALIEAIPHRYYPQISIHDHHPLAMRYGLGGIHLNSRHPIAPAEWQGIMSTSCHSIEELASRKAELINGRPFDYLSLSPIFDSISKQGYRSAFTPDALTTAHSQLIIDHRVLALGGVTFARLPQVKAMGFGGAMILGDAWR